MSIQVYTMADTDADMSALCVGVLATYITRPSRLLRECSLYAYGWHTPSKAKKCRP